MEGTGGGSGAGAHPDRQQHQQQDQPEQQQQQPAHTSWRAAGARGARAAGGGRPSSLGSRAPAGPAQDPVPRVAEQRPSMMSRTINKRATPPPPAPPAPSAPRRAPGASDDDPTAAALAAAASALALEASKPAAGKAGDGDAPKGSRPLARTPLSQTPTPPPVPELDGAAAADAADEELQEVAAGELDMTALADVSVPALPVQGKDQPPPRSQQQEEDDHEQEQGQEATEEAKPHKGRRFWAALRKTPIDPVSNRQICFGFNRGLLEDPPGDGCLRGAECPFAHVSLATVPGAQRALAILVAEARGEPVPPDPAETASYKYKYNDPRRAAASGGFGPRRGPQAHNPPPPPAAAMRMQASASDPGPLRDRAGPATSITAAGGGLEGAAGMRSQNPSPASSTTSGYVIPPSALPGAASGHTAGRMPRDAKGRRICYYFNRGGCANAACVFAHVLVDSALLADVPPPGHGRQRAPSYGGHTPAPAPVAAAYYAYPPPGELQRSGSSSMGSARGGGGGGFGAPQHVDAHGYHYDPYGAPPAAMAPPPTPHPHPHMIPMHGQPQEVVLYTHPAAAPGATATIATIVPVYHHHPMAPAPGPPEAGYHHQHAGAGGWAAVGHAMPPSYPPPTPPYVYGYISPPVLSRSPSPARRGGRQGGGGRWG